MKKKVTVQEVVNKEKTSPIPLDVFPNRMGINLVSVESITWNEREDGQIEDLTIKFIPETK